MFIVFGLLGLMLLRRALVLGLMHWMGSARRVLIHDGSCTSPKRKRGWGAAHLRFGLVSNAHLTEERR